MEMTSNRPYLIRAIYDWITDNQLTPYLVVDASQEGVQVPKESINSDGKIILNISKNACRGLFLELDRIVFTATFGTKESQLFIPPGAVSAIYAKENGVGMAFDPELSSAISGTEHKDAPPPTASSVKKTKKPVFKVVDSKKSKD